MEPNFVIVPKVDPLTILWRAFPELRIELDDEDCGAYYAYDRLADLLAGRPGDIELWRRASELFELLAAGGTDSETLLVIAILEPICEDSALAERLRDSLGPMSLRQLESME